MNALDVLGAIMLVYFYYKKMEQRNVNDITEMKHDSSGAKIFFLRFSKIKRNVEKSDPFERKTD